MSQRVSPVVETLSWLPSLIAHDERAGGVEADAGDVGRRDAGGFAARRADGDADGAPDVFRIMLGMIGASGGAWRSDARRGRAACPAGRECRRGRCRCRHRRRRHRSASAIAREAARAHSPRSTAPIENSGTGLAPMAHATEAVKAFPRGSGHLTSNLPPCSGQIRQPDRGAAALMLVAASIVSASFACRSLHSALRAERRLRRRRPTCRRSP